MADLSLELVLSATGGRLSGAARRRHSPAPAFLRGVSTDTRALMPGALFVALKGDRFDGHQFVADAFARGAGAALVSVEAEAVGALIVVPDPLLALGALAAAYRATLSPKMIAITGSTGKTSTKEMLGAILSEGWKTACLSAIGQLLRPLRRTCIVGVADPSRIAPSRRTRLRAIGRRWTWVGTYRS